MASFTRAPCTAPSAGYTPGELHRLTFPGQAHNASSWAARVALPLQLLFPPPRSSREALVL